MKYKILQVDKWVKQRRVWNWRNHAFYSTWTFLTRRICENPLEKNISKCFIYLGSENWRKKLFYTAQVFLGSASAKKSFGKGKKDGQSWTIVITIYAFRVKIEHEYQISNKMDSHSFFCLFWDHFLAILRPFFGHFKATLRLFKSNWQF